ncbi:hypothetical protein EGW08_011132 [Elysia chlorotica]|uniref:Uncharacterized protein n=1 Tax=Elysia chlorotica TaxID=188477 RepID=A0A3S1B6P3_ELYCH|nr:hypothetical protein EGW08_011132 [Elysia chlorotica]
MAYCCFSARCRPPSGDSCLEDQNTKVHNKTYKNNISNQKSEANTCCFKISMLSKDVDINGEACSILSPLKNTLSLSDRDKDLIKLQLSIWCPRVVSRPFSKGLSEVKSNIFQRLSSFTFLKRNRGLSESKRERKYLREICRKQQYCSSNLEIPEPLPKTKEQCVKGTEQRVGDCCSELEKPCPDQVPTLHLGEINSNHSLIRSKGSEDRFSDTASGIGDCCGLGYIPCWFISFIESTPSLDLDLLSNGTCEGQPPVVPIRRIELMAISQMKDVRKNGTYYVSIKEMVSDCSNASVLAEKRNSHQGAHTQLRKSVSYQSLIKSTERRRQKEGAFSEKDRSSVKINWKQHIRPSRKIKKGSNDKHIYRYNQIKSLQPKGMVQKYSYFTDNLPCGDFISGDGSNNNCGERQTIFSNIENNQIVIEGQRKVIQTPTIPKIKVAKSQKRNILSHVDISCTMLNVSNSSSNGVNRTNVYSRDYFSGNSKTKVSSSKGSGKNDLQTTNGKSRSKSPKKRSNTSASTSPDSRQAIFASYRYKHGEKNASESSEDDSRSGNTIDELSNYKVIKSIAHNLKPELSLPYDRFGKSNNRPELNRDRQDGEDSRQQRSRSQIRGKDVQNTYTGQVREEMESYSSGVKRKAISNGRETSPNISTGNTSNSGIKNMLAETVQYKENPPSREASTVSSLSYSDTNFQINLAIGLQTSPSKKFNFFRPKKNKRSPGVGKLAVDREQSDLGANQDISNSDPSKVSGANQSIVDQSNSVIKNQLVREKSADVKNQSLPGIISNKSGLQDETSAIHNPSSGVLKTFSKKNIHGNSEPDIKRTPDMIRTGDADNKIKFVNDKLEPHTKTKANNNDGIRAHNNDVNHGTTGPSTKHTSNTVHFATNDGNGVHSNDVNHDTVEPLTKPISNTGHFVTNGGTGENINGVNNKTAGPNTKQMSNTDHFVPNGGTGANNYGVNNKTAGPNTKQMSNTSHVVPNGGTGANNYGVNNKTAGPNTKQMSNTGLSVLNGGTGVLNNGVNPDMAEPNTKHMSNMGHYVNIDVNGVHSNGINPDTAGPHTTHMSNMGHYDGNGVHSNGVSPNMAGPNTKHMSNVGHYVNNDGNGVHSNGVNPNMAGPNTKHMSNVGHYVNNDGNGVRSNGVNPDMAGPNTKHMSNMVHYVNNDGNGVHSNGVNTDMAGPNTKHMSNMDHYVNNDGNGVHSNGVNPDMAGPNTKHMSNMGHYVNNDGNGVHSNGVNPDMAGPNTKHMSNVGHYVNNDGNGVHSNGVNPDMAGPNTKHMSNVGHYVNNDGNGVHSNGVNPDMAGPNTKHMSNSGIQNNEVSNDNFDSTKQSTPNSNLLLINQSDPVHAKEIHFTGDHTHQLSQPLPNVIEGMVGDSHTGNQKFLSAQDEISRNLTPWGTPNKVQAAAKKGHGADFIKFSKDGGDGPGESKQSSDVTFTSPHMLISPIGNQTSNAGGEDEEESAKPSPATSGPSIEKSETPGGGQNVPEDAQTASVSENGASVEKQDDAKENGDNNKQDSCLDTLSECMRKWGRPNCGRNYSYLPNLDPPCCRSPCADYLNSVGGKAAEDVQEAPKEENKTLKCSYSGFNEAKQSELEALINKHVSYLRCAQGESAAIPKQTSFISTGPDPYSQMCRDLAFKSSAGQSSCYPCGEICGPSICCDPCPKLPPLCRPPPCCPEICPRPSYLDSCPRLPKLCCTPPPCTDPCFPAPCCTKFPRIRDTPSTCPDPCSLLPKPNPCYSDPFSKPCCIDPCTRRIKPCTPPPYCVDPCDPCREPCLRMRQPCIPRPCSIDPCCSPPPCSVDPCKGFTGPCSPRATCIDPCTGYLRPCSPPKPCGPYPICKDPCIEPTKSCCSTYPICIDPCTGLPKSRTSRSCCIETCSGLPRECSSLRSCIDPCTGLPRLSCIDSCTGLPKSCVDPCSVNLMPCKPCASFPKQYRIDPITRLPILCSSPSNRLGASMDLCEKLSSISCNSASDTKLSMFNSFSFCKEPPYIPCPPPCGRQSSSRSFLIGKSGSVCRRRSSSLDHLKGLKQRQTDSQNLARKVQCVESKWSGLKEKACEVMDQIIKLQQEACCPSPCMDPCASPICNPCYNPCLSPVCAPCTSPICNPCVSPQICCPRSCTPVCSSLRCCPTAGIQTSTVCCACDKQTSMGCRSACNQTSEYGRYPSSKCSTSCAQLNESSNKKSQVGSKNKFAEISTDIGPSLMGPSHPRKRGRTEKRCTIVRLGKCDDAGQPKDPNANTDVSCCSTQAEGGKIAEIAKFVKECFDDSAVSAISSRPVVKIRYNKGEKNYCPNPSQDIHLKEQIAKAIKKGKRFRKRTAIMEIIRDPELSSDLKLTKILQEIANYIMFN